MRPLRAYLDRQGDGFLLPEDPFSPTTPLKPWTEMRIPRRTLYNRTGHLLISPAHMKGC